MSFFEYPINEKELLKNKRKIKKEILNNGRQKIKKKIAILGGSTTNEIADQIEIFLLHYDIEVDIFQSSYGRYWEEAIFDNIDLEKFKPDIIYIHTNWRNIKFFPNPQYDEDHINKSLEKEYRDFELMWDNLSKKFNCYIIQNNFERPNYRLLGNKDISEVYGRSHYISRLNQKFYDYSRKNKNFFINDIEYISSCYGLENWNDSFYWYMYKYAMNLYAMPHIANSITNIIKSIYGKNKKVLVLDLDNTLWGGVIGDDGIDNIEIGPETPEGLSYLDFQNYCKELKTVGIVLAICSKNEYENAILGLNNKYSLLKEEDFVSIKANWDSKDLNIQQISDELNLGLDSFVFVDDNPVERDIVRNQKPLVSVPEIDKVENFIKFIEKQGYFEITNLSKEDIEKTSLYKSMVDILNSKSLYENYSDYLKSLDMKAIIKPFDIESMSRIVQLTNKSNQFNLTTMRCSNDDISKMSNSDKYITLYGRLIDKFADNGIISIVSGEIISEDVHIRLWLMSCRVIKRDMEFAMLDEFVKQAKNMGVNSIFGYYYPTEKNSMVKNFYETMGFEFIDSDDEGNTKWFLDVKEYLNKNVSIELI